MHGVGCCMITLHKISKSYKKTRVIKDLSLEVKDGEFTVLIGPSGCGKTTTLKMINRLIEPDEGTITVAGKNIRNIDPIRLRRSIGYVIQQTGLFPNMTVAQNIAVVPKLLRYDKKRIDDIVHSLLKLVKMPYDAFAEKYPHQLSGGQQQRVGVLRALAGSPPIILMDEPFGALDPMTRSALQEEMKNLQQQLNKTIVFVTHDMDEALNLADKIVFMDKGRIIQAASPEEMLENPASDLIRSFMGKRLSDSGQTVSTAADFMRTDVHKVYKTRGVRECLQIMDRHNVDSLLVMNADKTYAGVVFLKNLKELGKTGKIAIKKDAEGRIFRTIEPFVEMDNLTSFVDEEAKICFDKLLHSDSRYNVILNHDRTIAGIVTNTSVAKALADAFWSDDE